jgi:hypothetical protein
MLRAHGALTGNHDAFADYRTISFSNRSISQVGFSGFHGRSTRECARLFDLSGLFLWVLTVLPNLPASNLQVRLIAAFALSGQRSSPAATGRAAVGGGGEPI